MKHIINMKVINIDDAHTLESLEARLKVFYFTNISDSRIGVRNSHDEILGKMSKSSG